MQVLLPKKQQLLGDGIPSLDDEQEEIAIEEISVFTKSTHELMQQTMRTANLKIQKICHECNREPLKNTLFLSFEGDHINPAQKFISRSLNPDDFNSEVNLESNHQLLFPIEYEKITELSSKDRDHIQEITYEFKSHEPLLNVRLVRDVIESLKNSSTMVEKIKFAHDFSVVAWFLLTTFEYFWENLDEVIVAERGNGKLGFLPVRSYPYSWKMELMQQTDSSQFNLNYIAYFKNLLERLFGITEENLKPKKAQENKLNQVSSKERIIKLYKSLSQKPLPEELFETVPSTLLKIYSHEVSNEPQPKKAKKFESKQNKREKILECLKKYTFLFVLDISNIAEHELLELKQRVKKEGQGEYYYYPLKLFTTEILPHITQFKGLRKQQLKNTKSMKSLKQQKGQTSLLFTNQNLDEAHLLIDSIMTKRSLPPQTGVKVREDITFPAEKIVGNYSHAFLCQLQQLGIEGLNRKGCIIARQDLTIKKGTALSPVQSAVLREIQSCIPENRTPFKHKLKILHVFENGYLLPKNALGAFSNHDELVAEAMRKSFGLVRAIQVETDLKILDPVEIMKAQESFIELSKLFIAIHCNYIGKVPKKFQELNIKSVRVDQLTEEEVDDEICDLFNELEWACSGSDPKQPVPQEPHLQVVERFGDY